MTAWAWEGLTVLEVVAIGRQKGRQEDMASPFLFKRWSEILTGLKVVKFKVVVVGFGLVRLSEQIAACMISDQVLSAPKKS